MGFAIREAAFGSHKDAAPAELGEFSFCLVSTKMSPLWGWRNSLRLVFYKDVTPTGLGELLRVLFFP
jgi:hypothetical protein